MYGKRVSKDKLFAAVIFCSLSAYILLYLVLGWFAHPAADDYWFANKVVDEGFLHSQVSWYSGWTGRYASTAIISAYLALFGLLRFFWVIPALLLAGTTASFASLFLWFPRKHRLTVFEAICAGLILTALYLSGVPSTAESFYWLAGGVTYQLANCLYLLLLATLAKLHYGDADTGTRAFWLAAPLVLIIAGLNETVMLLQFLTIMLALCLGFTTGSRQRHLVAALLLLSLLGAAVVIIAPGNAVRLANFPLAHRFLFSLQSSLSTAGTQFLTWSTAAPLWLASLIWLPVASEKVGACGHPRWRGTFTVSALLIWLSLLVALYFPAFWSMGSPPPTRTLSTAYLVFIIGWFVVLTGIAACMPLRQGIFSAGALRLMAAALGVLLFVTGNGTTACSDLAIAPAYSKQLKERYALLAAAGGGKLSDLKVPALDTHPETIAIQFGDIGANKDDWKNKNCAGYFHMKSVATVWKQQ